MMGRDMTRTLVIAPKPGNGSGMDPMSLALEEARRAAQRGEVPVGAVVVAPDGAVLAAAGNETEASGDPSAHAELLALRRAGMGRALACDLYVTLEPCAMCAGAISLFRVRRVYFGAYDPKGGAVEHGPRYFSQPTCLHRPEAYGGLREADCAGLLREFFARLRQNGSEGGR